MLKQLKTAGIVFAFFVILTGLVYPALVTLVAQGIFPAQANGSLIVENGQVRGSTLIGQNFDDPRYFWGRLSATGGSAYNASASGGSNASVLNPDLAQRAQDRIAALRAADPQNTQPVPVDLVTASASGLDPDISPAAAQYQAARVARVRGMTEADVRALISRYTQGRVLGFLGEERVNVLLLNRALDAAQSQAQSQARPALQ